jgi:tRNA A-37 threonylcarbamoyl transferase component Bud32
MALSLIAQGAEARVWSVAADADGAWPPAARAALASSAGASAAPPPFPLLAKERFSKSYRHALLDAALQASRTAGEVRKRADLYKPPQRPGIG